MCGIVGMVGSGIQYADKKMFGDLLRVDTIRGEDSTGIVCADKDEVVTFKKAINGFDFTDLSTFSKKVLEITSPSLFIGHNRAATRGGVNTANAHPFQDGSTHLVHNGTLTTWKSILHNAKDTDVDSKAVCYNVEHEGLEQTVPKLQGAFAIVTYDETSKIVQFVRNDKRPLWFIANKDRDVLYYASEPDMITLCASRHKIVLSDEGAWKLGTGTIMSFDLAHSGKILESADKKEVKLYTPPPAPNYGRTERPYSSPSEGRVQGTTTYTTKGTQEGTSSNVLALPNSKQAQVRQLEQMGLPTDGKLVHFLPDQFEKFHNSGEYGFVYGSLYGTEEEPAFITDKAIMFGITPDKYIDMAGQMVQVRPSGVTKDGAQYKEGLPSVAPVHILTKDQETKFWNNFADYAGMTDEWATFEYDEEDNYFGADGTYINEDEFAELVSCGCGACGNPIPVSPTASLTLEWVFGDEPVCLACQEYYGTIQQKFGLNSIEEAITV